MDKIIIFKSDKVGDFINFSPCLKIIKDNIKDSHVTLICSDYNIEVAKNYSYVDEFIIFNNKNIFINIFKNLRKLFFSKYTYLFQFDGKSSSYNISYFIRSNIKSTICFVKHKRIFGINYTTTRPVKFLLKIFYNNFIYCDERYSHHKNTKSSIHYQTNYFNLLEMLNFKITDKKNLFFLDKSYEQQYNNFYQKFINSNFCLFHFDEKWNKLKIPDYKNSLKIINKLSQKYKVIITTGTKNFIFLKDLKDKFFTFNFVKNKFFSKNEISKNNVILIENLPLNLWAYFIKNSEINISFHSGALIHIAPAFDKQIIDLIPKSKNDELDRWIPIISKYKRINFEELNDELIENI